MPINKETTVIVRVSMRKETKMALDAVAEKKGLSLSFLMLSAAVNTYLISGKHKTKTEETLEKKTVEVKLPGEVVDLNNYRTLHVNMLWQRFEKDKEHDKMLKSRLMIIGSYDRLFNLRARKHSEYVKKVESFTKDRDPENLPWFPTNNTRQFWVQMDGNEFKKYLSGLNV